MERKKAELSNLEEISRIRKAKAEAEESETLAKLRIERASIEAEEKMLECCSQRGSQISSASKMQACSRSALSMMNGNRSRIKANTFRLKSDVNDMKSPVIKSHISKLETAVKTAFASTSEGFENKNVKVKPQFSVTEPKLRFNNVTDIIQRWTMDFAQCNDAISRPANGNENRAISHVGDKSNFNCMPYLYTANDESNMQPSRRRSALTESDELGLLAYLQRQGRNEFINLASQIAFDEINLAFVFYENQIRRLMNERSYDERRLEVRRASCVGQPREMVNLFCAPMRGVTTSRRIEKALDRLRQRYGVSGGVSSELEVMAIRI